MVKVRLVIASFNLENYLSQAVHILKKYALQEALVESHFAIDAIDLKISDSDSSVLSKLSKYQVVCFSVYLWNSEKIASIVGKLKGSRTIVLGGPEITNNLEYYKGLKAFTGCIFITGGGGEAFAEALSDLVAGKTRDVYGSSPVDGALPVVYGSADFLRHSAAHVRSRGEKVKLIFSTSTGCVYRCAYCTWGGKKLVFFPDKYVHGELRSLLRNPHISLLYIADSDMCMNKARAVSILRTLNRYSRRSAAEFIYMEFNPASLNEDVVELLERNDKIIGSFGLQTSDQGVMRGISRHVDLEKYRRSISLFRKTGKPLCFDIILGLPGDTTETFLGTLDFALSLGASYLNIFPLYVLPGSELHRRARELGLRYSPEPPYKLRSSASMSSLKDMEKISVWLQIILCFESVTKELNSIPARRRIDVYVKFIRFLLRDRSLASLRMSLDYRDQTDISRFYTAKFESRLLKKLEKFSVSMLGPRVPSPGG